MSKIQTTFGDPAVGFLGHAHDNSAALVDSAPNTGAGNIAFGRAVKASGAGVDVPASLADEFVGVTVADPLVPIIDETTGDRAYKPGASVGVLSRGRVNVLAEQTVAVTDPVFVRTATGAGGETAGAFRKDSDGATGTKRKQTLTLSGALDGGRERVQKLVLDADLVAGDTVDGAIDGQAITQVAYAASHATTMQSIVKAIEQAAETAAVAAGGDPSIVEIYVAGATGREIHIVSKYAGASKSPLTAWATAHGGAGTASFASATGADVQAGKEPHGLSVQLDGGAALVQDWAGTSDATLAGFAALLASQAAIESAVVSKGTDTGGGVDDADRIVTVTSASASPTANAFTNPTVSGGVTARTMAVAQTQAGVAPAAKAAQWTSARWHKGASAGGIAVLEVFRA